MISRTKSWLKLGDKPILKKMLANFFLDQKLGFPADEMSLRVY